MILVRENLSFIQKFEHNTSFAGRFKYHLAGRVSLLTTSLFWLAEAVVHGAVGSLACIAYVATCGACGCLPREKVQKFTEKQFDIASMAGKVCAICFLSVYSPQTLAARLMNSPVSGLAREVRTRHGTEVIQRKLLQELMCARRQMIREGDGEEFHYAEGNHGVAERVTVGSLDVGVCHFIGRRPSMEDEHLAQAFTLRIGEVEYPVQLFGIFDGHGGPQASMYLKNNLQRKLQETLVEFNPERLTDEGVWNALKLTFVRLNQEFTHPSAGSTATVALILNGLLWTANVGDSRTILDNTMATSQLSEDAKPGDPRYQKGIENRGGTVIWNNGMRVNGYLSTARSVGDHHLGGAVSARPKITVKQIAPLPSGSHLVLACDGIYDVASTNQVGQLVRDHRDVPVDRLAKNIVAAAFEARSEDNLSVMVVRFP